MSEEYKCEICNLVLGSKLIYDHHIVGQKHIKKHKIKEKNDSLKCNICTVQSTNEVILEIGSRIMIKLILETIYIIILIIIVI